MNLIFRMGYLFNVIRRQWLLWLVCVISSSVIYYALLLLALVIKFQAIPNYVNVYGWFDSVVLIIKSTPSWKDIYFIVKEEWWLEIGFMNYDFGTGISEWSLFVAPAKVVNVLIFCSLIFTYIFTLKDGRQKCNGFFRYSSTVTTGLGGIFVSMTSITMSWVVCCATPTWIVGLAIMGLGVSTSLWLEPIGFWLNALGYVLLMVSLWLVTSKKKDLDEQEYFDNLVLENK